MLSMPTPLPLIRASHLNFMIKSMLNFSSEIQVDALLEQAGINPERLNDPNNLLLEKKVWHFLTLVADSQQIPHLGFCISENNKLIDYYPFSEDLLVAGSLYQAFQILIKRVNVQNNYNALWLQESEGVVWICYPQHIKCKLDLWQIEQVMMSLSCKLITHYAGLGWLPKQARFQDKEGLGIEQSLFFQNTKVKLGQRYSAIAIEPELLVDRTMINTPSASFKVGDIPSSFTESFKALLKQNYFGKDWLAEDIAATLEMSVRTLKRKLQSKGTSLREVFDEIRFVQACDLIDQNISDYKELAERLSYTHPNNFVRAFKRWSGTTPREYIRLRKLALTKNQVTDQQASHI